MVNWHIICSLSSRGLTTRGDTNIMNLTKEEQEMYNETGLLPNELCPACINYFILANPVSELGTEIQELHSEDSKIKFKLCKADAALNLFVELQVARRATETEFQKLNQD